MHTPPPSPAQARTSALTQKESQNFRPHPRRLRLRGSVGLDLPSHAADGSPYPLKTLFLSNTHSGTWRYCPRLYFTTPHYRSIPPVALIRTIIIKTTHARPPFKHIHTRPFALTFSHTHTHKYPRPNKPSTLVKTVANATAGTEKTTREGNKRLPRRPLADSETPTGRPYSRHPGKPIHPHTHTSHSYRGGNALDRIHVHSHTTPSDMKSKSVHGEESIFTIYNNLCTINNIYNSYIYNSNK